MDTKTIVRFVRYWLPAIIWMTVIFLVSSKQRVSVSDQESTNFLVFKTLHMMEYAFLYFLLFRGFYSLKFKNLSLPERLLIPFIVAMFYAATDEFHQTLTPHREGTPRDVIIDTAGIFFMYIYIRSHINFVKKFI
jgi:VanZ family protein